MYQKPGDRVKSY